MKILKLLNNKYLSIILIFFIFLISKVFANEPVDIWNLDKKKKTEESKNIEISDEEEIVIESIYKTQSQQSNILEIKEDENLLSEQIKIVGLYDPGKNGLTIDMWSNSDGEQIINIFKRIKKIDLSIDAKEILNILLLTNSYSPNQNISYEQFQELKSDWLIKNNDLELIENYLLQNNNINENIQLTKFLMNQYLSKSNIEKLCSIVLKIKEVVDDNYLSKLNIYCLINSDQREIAQLQFDLKKEIGFKDNFFEKKFNYLLGYETEVDNLISEKTILDFHLSHRTNPNFKFEPNKNTSKNIWRYLSVSNLLDNIENVDLEDQNKINIIEKATHERNYAERELYDLYKRFQFNIDQLLTVKQSYKLLSNIEARALVYQGVLITSEPQAKLDLIKILKGLFIKDEIGEAFKDELSRFLKQIDEEEVPSNYTKFYNKYINEKEINLTKIKINNKIIHQSKLLNYFRYGSVNKNLEKDLNDLLKKIKKNKEYSVSTKDIILIESLKSDGTKLLKKYDNLYELDNYNMPTDIQILIDSNEIGLVLLRIVEVIGQDELEVIGSETLYFIINALNQLDIDPIRNKILLKVLPLKV